MIFRDKKDEDISYSDLMEIARDIAYANEAIAYVEMKNKDYTIFSKALEQKQEQLLHYIDQACVDHQGAGKFYPYGFAVLVDSIEEDNKRIRALDSNAGAVYYGPDKPYMFSTEYEREANAWWTLKNAVFEYGLKHGYIQLGPKERTDKEILSGIKAGFCALEDERIKIVGRDFSEEELDEYLGIAHQMKR